MVAHLQPNSERAKWITKYIASFIALDLKPYSVVENVCFGTMVFTLGPRYKIPSQHYFIDTAIQTLGFKHFDKRGQLSSHVLV